MATNLINIVKSGVKQTTRSLGFELRKVSKKPPSNFPSDFTEDEKIILQKVMPFTLTSQERVVSFTRAIEHVHKNKIEGDIVECGVWKGGSMMAACYELHRLGGDRNLWLYDTFEGMSEPTEADVNFSGEAAKDHIEREIRLTCVGYEDVEANLLSTGYPIDRMHFVQGKVEDTIPQKVPQKISILRLDTDWYESTLHELEHLYPLLVQGGVLIVDDYGHWQGARKAVDEYFKKNDIAMLLNRVDYTCRIGVKLAYTNPIK